MKYIIKIYFNGIHWDDSYTDDKTEAEYIKSYMEDKSRSVWDRANESALIDFIQDYNIQCVENIEITVEIVEDN